MIYTIHISQYFPQSFHTSQLPLHHPLCQFHKQYIQNVAVIHNNQTSTRPQLDLNQTKQTSNRPQIDLKQTSNGPKIDSNRPKIDPKQTPNRPQIDLKQTSGTFCYGVMYYVVCQRLQWGTVFSNCCKFNADSAILYLANTVQNMTRLNGVMAGYQPQMQS